jgi:hypothetical protein
MAARDGVDEDEAARVTGVTQHTRGRLLLITTFTAGEEGAEQLFGQLNALAGPTERDVLLTDQDQELLLAAKPTAGLTCSSAIFALLARMLADATRRNSASLSLNCGGEGQK